MNRGHAALIDYLKQAVLTPAVLETVVSAIRDEVAKLLSAGSKDVTVLEGHRFADQTDRGLDGLVIDAGSGLEAREKGRGLRRRRRRLPVESSRSFINQEEPSPKLKLLPLARTYSIAESRFEGRSGARSPNQV